MDNTDSLVRQHCKVLLKDLATGKHSSLFRGRDFIEDEETFMRLADEWNARDLSGMRWQGNTTLSMTALGIMTPSIT